MATSRDPVTVRDCLCPWMGFSHGLHLSTEMRGKGREDQVQALKVLQQGAGKPRLSHGNIGRAAMVLQMCSLRTSLAPIAI